MQSEKMELRGGFDFQVLSRAPWTEALPDSPALAAAWTLAFLSLNGRLEKLSGQRDGGASSAAPTRTRRRTSRWTPEVYACVLGGMLFMEPGRPEPRGVAWTARCRAS